MTNNLKELQTHLAKDLVEFEVREVAEEHAELIEQAYAKVYDIVADILCHEHSMSKQAKD